MRVSVTLYFDIDVEEGHTPTIDDIEDQLSDWCEYGDFEGLEVKEVPGNDE